MIQKSFSRSYLVRWAAALVLIALVVEIIFLLPSALERWHPFDYGLYTEMGRAVREGINPYGENHYWPLPTMLWVFVPLSLLPDWFRLVWILGPFLSILVLFRARGMLLFLFAPLWFVVSDAMIEGWLLLPLAWLLENRPMKAGVGAALVLFKPQLAILAVSYFVFKWLASRDWRNIGVFGGLMVLFYIPSFIVRPNWIGEMLRVLPGRAAQTTTLLPLLTGSIWAWWFLGGIGIPVFFTLIVGLLILSARTFPNSQTRPAGFLLLNLILNPILFASNLIMALPVLQTRDEIIAIVLLGLAAYALDRALGGFGGGYVMISLAALYFQTRRPAIVS